MSDIAIIVPTYNERDNVGPLVDALNAAMGTARRFEIIFVDDWSTDGTAEAVTAVAQRHPNVRLIRRHGRRGLSTAVVEGVLSTHAPIFAVIDGDLQHDERILPAMIDAVAESSCDVAIGSRYVGDGSIGDWDATRAKGSAVATTLSKMLLNTPVGDPMSGFFAARTSDLIAAVPHLSNMGFKILLDLLASSQAPLRTREFAYTFRSRVAGESKLDSSVAIDFLLMLIDKKFRGLVPPRLFLFGIVGLLGLVVHLVLLRIALAAGAAFSLANTIAVLSAIAFNFFLNNRLTYRDRRLRGWPLVWGLISFYAVCGLGAIANVGVGSVAFKSHYSWWVAGVAGAIVGSVWNFAASSLLTWRKRS